jgi:hypothetical protein
MTSIRRILRPLGGLFLLSALVALAVLLLSDSWRHFRPTGLHQRAGALSLMLVGASFICVQLDAHARLRTKIKRVLLGVAFVLWGGEQFLPQGMWVTAMDGAVVAIFVVDIGLVILGLLKRRSEDLSPSPPR